MATLFYRYHRLTILAITLLLAAGLGAFFSLGRQEDPTLVERYGTITTPYAGASAERVEALITEPLEDAINELAEIDETFSTSRSGVSVIGMSIREDLSQAEVDQTWTKIREQVDSVRPFLPAASGAPDVDRQYIGAATIIVALSWADVGEENIGILSRLGLDLERELRNMPGTEETRIFGEAEEEIRVEVDPERLASLGLSVADVASLTNSADAKVPAGEIRAGASDLGVEIDGEFDGIDRIRSIALTDGQDGRFVRLGDVAEVSRGERQPTRSLATTQGQRTVLVAAYLQPDLRADVWAERADTVVAAFAESVPGIQVETIFRQGDYVESRLNGLATNLGYSALIVFAVLFLMMGWRAAFIVGSALPLTVLTVMLLMRLFDEPLHQMSVTGLVVALGLLIDNAIVVVEEYRLLRAKGQSPLEALDGAVRLLFAPLLASTLTTVFAFAPIALMPGSAGEFISMIGISVIFAITASFLLAMTVVGALAAWFDDPKVDGGPRRFWRTGLHVAPLAWIYKRILTVIVERPWVGIFASVLLPIAGFVAASTLPMQFFPPTDRDMFQLELELPSTASIEETRRQTERAREIIERYDGIERVTWTIGESSPRTYYNVVGNKSGVSNYAAGFVHTESAQATARILPLLQQEMMREFPQARVLTLPFEQGPPIPAPIELVIVGPELAELDRIGSELRTLLASTPTVTYTMAQLEMGEPVARVMADEASTELAGLRLSDLANQLRSDLDGVVGGSVLEGIEELPVRIIASADRRASLSDVSGAPLRTADGELVAAPLSALGEITLAPQVAQIPHEDGRRINRIYAYLDPFTLPATALSSFMQRLDEAGLELPPGYELQMGGEAAERGDAVGNLLGTAVPLIVLMIGSVVLAFNSFRFAGVILTVAFLSVGLAMFGVWLFGTPMGFNAIVGSMGLMGLSINGAIVVLSALKVSPEASALEEGSVVSTVMDATRHIISTTLTTIGGFIPLLLSGDNFWLPFASAMVGGVSGSAILALIFAPAAFVLLMRSQSKARRLMAAVKRHSGQDEISAVPAE
ncbi:efflux RND transporter permease subunit [Maricaulis sp.]|uniref:efflux RND transporter permease subunit n=1 Tax=Maricaulis sp. TaxID=1486257 RepID=UPI001B273B61|nr:efflux RND transporter permease subunit [Maricaulis sp.]MBO6796902.1 efflux RND transporter permease subunit [Maricaulis sp.]